MNKKAIKILIVSVIIAVIVGGTIAGIIVVNLDRKKEKLVVYNWADYIDPANITLFEEYYTVSYTHLTLPTSDLV